MEIHFNWGWILIHREYTRYSIAQQPNYIESTLLWSYRATFCIGQHCLLQLFEAFYAVFKTEGESQQKALKEMEEKLDLLEYGMSKYFADGKSCSFADGKPVDVNENNAEMLDLMFYSLLGLYKSYEEVFGVKLLDEDKFPLLFPWLMAFVQLKVVKEATPPHEKVVQFLHFVRHSALRSASAAS